MKSERKEIYQEFALMITTNNQIKEKVDFTLVLVAQNFKTFGVQIEFGMQFAKFNQKV